MTPINSLGPVKAESACDRVVNGRWPFARADMTCLRLHNCRHDYIVISLDYKSHIDVLSYLLFDSIG